MNCRCYAAAVSVLTFWALLLSDYFFFEIKFANTFCPYFVCSLRFGTVGAALLEMAWHPFEYTCTIADIDSNPLTNSKPNRYANACLNLKKCLPCNYPTIFYANIF